MQVKYLNINKYKYKVEYIPFEECNSIDARQQKFVMLRNFTLLNNIVADDNIYFIEQSIYEQYKESLIDKSENKFLVFPSNKDTMYYSSEYHIFNDTYIDNDLITGTGIYEILEKKTEIKDNETFYKFEQNPINCDLIKIYHPSIKSKQNLIIHIENVINNIHFHYLCTKYQWYYLPENNTINKQYGSDDEYKYENNIYSEYIKCYIPSIRELFDRIILDKDIYDYKWYFKENLNIINDISNKNLNFVKDTIITLNENGITNQYVPITLFTQPFLLEEYTEDLNNNDVIEPDERIFKKVYFKYKFKLDNSYVTTPLNISLYPYISLNESTKIYSLSDELLPGTSSIIYDYSFNVAGKICFNNIGEISLLCYFNYPFKEIFEQKYNDQSDNYALADAYCFYNHISNRQGTYLRELKEVYFEELDEINSIKDIDEDTINFLIHEKMADRNPILSSECPTKKDYYIKQLKESRWQLFLEEYIDEFRATIDFFGFKIEVSSDKNFKNIILEKNISLLEGINIEQLMDNIFTSNQTLDIFAPLRNGVFFFPINGLFTDWKQMPEIVVARITFIDRFIGQEIQSNNIFISKEKFKYITNVDSIKRVNQLVELNKNYNEDMIELNLDINQRSQSFNTIIDKIDNESIKNELIEWYNENPQQYSFINKINCKVENVTNDNKFTDKSNNKTNIIYKPIFFKTNKLNNLQIKYLQNQNVGIDLHEYMSKVDLFMMTIDGNTYYEIGRNTNFVLFNINASNIKNESGTFEIYNNDHEYITYGTWSIIR